MRKFILGVIVTFLVLILGGLGFATLGFFPTRANIAPPRWEHHLANAAVDRLLAKERALGDKLTFADIAEEVAGIYPRVMQQGDMDAGGWSCGMVAGLIRDIPTCKELIDRIMAGAEALIRRRLEGLLSAG